MSDTLAALSVLSELNEGLLSLVSMFVFSTVINAKCCHDNETFLV